MIAASNVADVIQRAVLTLAGRCDGARTEDGVGYNRYDAYWGRTAAEEIESGKSINIEKALRVVSKYRRQLEGAGITLPDPETVAREVEEQRAARVATTQQAISPAITGVEVARWTGDSIILRFAYDREKVERARGLPGRKFDGAQKAWVVPFASLGAVMETFPEAILTGTLGAELRARQEAEAAAERARIALIASDIARYDSIRATLGRTPFDHQDTGIRWLIENRFAILADDMGLGKTLQALVAARALGHRIFVVCPAGLRINWLREAQTVGAQVEVFSWAKVPEPVGIDYTLIADEAHYAQNMKAARTKRFLELAKKAKACFCLSGTPIKNGRPANLYPLLVATKHTLAGDRRAFEIRYCNAGPTRWSQWDVTGAAHLDELHGKIADGLLRRMKDECLDLPEKQRMLREAELSPTMRDLYESTLREMQSEYRRKKEAGEIGEADALVLMNHLRHAGSLAKVDTAVELAEEVIEQGGQVVIFTAFLDSAEQIAVTLNAGRIAGNVDTETRQAAIDRFQAGELRAMVCTLGAGNVGITLTAAQTVILVDRPWTPGDAIQAEDRLHRIGQKGSVFAVWLQANEADVAIDELLEQKHERIELVLAGKRKSLKGLRSIGDVAAAVLG